MRRIMDLLGMTLVGALGWWLGAFVGMGTAVLLSSIGTGAGLYLSRRLAREYLP